MSFVFYCSLKPQVQRLIRSGFTGKSRKYAIDRVGDKVYVAAINEFGRAGEFRLVVKGRGAIITGKEAK
jgi:hypothetical protein